MEVTEILETFTASLALSQDGYPIVTTLHNVLEHVCDSCETKNCTQCDGNYLTNLGLRHRTITLEIHFKSRYEYEFKAVQYYKLQSLFTRKNSATLLDIIDKQYRRASGGYI